MLGKSVWIMATAGILFACTDQDLPDRTISSSSLATSNSAYVKAAGALTIGGQTGVLSDLPAEALTQRCAPAVQWLNERMRTAGVLTREQLSALGRASQYYQGRIRSTGDRADLSPHDINDQLSASSAENFQIAIACLRRLPSNL